MIELDDLPPANGGDGDNTRGAYRRARGWRNRVTEAEVCAAVESFEAGGGIIRIIESETVPPNKMVGHYFGIYELITGGNNND